MGPSQLQAVKWAGHLRIKPQDHNDDTVKVLVPLDGVGRLPPEKVFQRISFTAYPSKIIQWLNDSLSTTSMNYWFC